jgi:hypothetical protein
VNPLSKMTDIAAGSLKVAVTVGRTAVGLARSAVGTITSRPGSGTAEAPSAGTTEPVNVTEKLGIDPAPVAKPKPTRRTQQKPTTSIDAAADPSKVDVTPADVAEVVSGKSAT